MLEFKQAIPFKRFTGGCGRHTQAKNLPSKLGKASGDQVGWPVKSTKYMLDLWRNLESNGETKGLHVERLVITHLKVDRARQLRRRTFRAHGRITAYLRSPCHVEIVATEKNQQGVRKEQDKQGKVVLVTRKQAARNRMLKVGGDVE